MPVKKNTTNRSIRRGRVLAVVFAFAVLATACSSDSDTIQIGNEPFAPDVESGAVDSEATGNTINFSYKTFDDETVEFADLPEGPVVLNFFASWCPSCIAELPDFETVSQNFGGEVTFLGLATQDRSENSVELLEQTGVTFATGKDQNGEIFSLFQGLAMPTTVFLDANHEVVRVHSGVFDVESLTETINDDLLS